MVDNNQSLWSRSNSSTKMLMGVVAFVFAIGLIVALFYGAGWAIEKVQVYSKPTASIGTVDFEGYGWIGSALSVALSLDGPGNSIPVELLVLMLALFFIVFFAFSEIIEFFTVGIFSPVTAWIIGFALAIVMGALKVYKLLAGLMVGVTIIGGFSVAIILVTAFITAVILNLFVGKNLRKWAMERQAFSDALKAQKGSNRMVSAIRALKEAAREFEAP